MWALVRNQNQYRFSEISDGATLGSATSNQIVLNQKMIKPLEGQFRKSDQGWIYRDFGLGTVTPITEGKPIRIDEWTFEIFETAKNWDLFYFMASRAFKEILKEQPSLSFEEALEELRTKYFLSGRPPKEAVEFLKAQYEEYCLAGPIEKLLVDREITDLLIQRYDCIWIERKGRLALSPFRFSNEENYRIYIENLLIENRVSWDEAHPYLDFTLKSGERIHLVGPPVSTQFCLSIRKPREDAISLKVLEELGMMPPELTTEIRQFVSDRKNLLVCGATGSGKTTLLKSLLLEMPGDTRTLVLEDTPELEVPLDQLVFLKTRLSQRSELPPITLRDLVRQSLRMRPDRIVIGEVRGGEAMDLLHAMNTGHRGSMASLHANSARDALYRLEGLVQMSDARLSEGVVRDLIARNIHVVLYCHKRDDGRRAIQEVVSIRGRDRDQILLEVLYEEKP